MTSIKIIPIRRLQPVKPSTYTINTNYDTYFDNNSNKNVNTENLVYISNDYDFQVDNKFIETYLSAYINHGNAVFSPSDLLFVFNMSFAKFSKDNNDLVKKYVNPEFDGTKKELEVMFFDSNPDKLKIINDMIDNVRCDMYNSTLLEVLSNNFESATGLEKTACNVAILDSVEKFYKFRFQSYCGFNNIKFIGSVDDWKKLKSKVEDVKNMFLENSSWKTYCDKFLHILGKFISCYRSEYMIDYNFLEKMIDANYDYGFYGDRTSTASGWIFDLFYGFKNDYIMSEIPNMTCQVPVIVDNKSYKLFSGFVGMTVMPAEKIDSNYEYDISGNPKLLKRYYKKYNLKNQSDNDSDNQSDNDFDNQSDNDSDNQSDNSDNQSDNDSNNQSDDEDNYISEYNCDMISRVLKNKTDTIYDYRPVLACYFTDKHL